MKLLLHKWSFRCCFGCEWFVAVWEGLFGFCRHAYTEYGFYGNRINVDWTMESAHIRNTHTQTHTKVDERRQKIMFCRDVIVSHAPFSDIFFVFSFHPLLPILSMRCARGVCAFFFFFISLLEIFHFRHRLKYGFFFCFLYLFGLIFIFSWFAGFVRIDKCSERIGGDDGAVSDDWRTDRRIWEMQSDEFLNKMKWKIKSIIFTVIFFFFSTFNSISITRWGHHTRAHKRIKSIWMLRFWLIRWLHVVCRDLRDTFSK